MLNTTYLFRDLFEASLSVLASPFIVSPFCQIKQLLDQRDWGMGSLGEVLKDKIFVL